MKEKIKVLVLPSDKSGVGKFRSVDPHIMLQNMYPDDFHVDIDYEPKINDINYWKKYQIVHVHRNVDHLLTDIHTVGIEIKDIVQYAQKRP